MTSGSAYGGAQRPPAGVVAQCGRALGAHDRRGARLRVRQRCWCPGGRVGDIVHWGRVSVIFTGGVRDNYIGDGDNDLGMFLAVTRANLLGISQSKLMSARHTPQDAGVMLKVTATYSTSFVRVLQ